MAEVHGSFISVVIEKFFSLSLSLLSLSFSLAYTTYFGIHNYRLCDPTLRAVVWLALLSLH